MYGLGAGSYAEHYGPTAPQITDAVAKIVDPRACKSLLLMSVGVNIFNIVKHSAEKIHKYKQSWYEQYPCRTIGKYG